MTGCLSVWRFEWFSRPLDFTQYSHHGLYGKCVRLCVARCWSVGSFGLGSALASLAALSCVSCSTIHDRVRNAVRSLEQSQSSPDESDISTFVSSPLIHKWLFVLVSASLVEQCQSIRSKSIMWDFSFVWDIQCSSRCLMGSDPSSWSVNPAVWGSQFSSFCFRSIEQFHQDFMEFSVIKVTKGHHLLIQCSSTVSVEIRWPLWVPNRVPCCRWLCLSRFRFFLRHSSVFRRGLRMVPTSGHSLQLKHSPSFPVWIHQHVW